MAQRVVHWICTWESEFCPPFTSKRFLTERFAANCRDTLKKTVYWLIWHSHWDTVSSFCVRSVELGLEEAPRIRYCLHSHHCSLAMLDFYQPIIFLLSVVRPACFSVTTSLLFISTHKWLNLTSSLPPLSGGQKKSGRLELLPISWDPHSTLSQLPLHIQSLPQLWACLLHSTRILPLKK